MLLKNTGDKMRKVRRSLLYHTNKSLFNSIIHNIIK